MRNMMRNDEAFTGLEAAIVLIAFVVVAAVFSYVVLGAGFFTTQKSQEVVYTGVSQASSSIEILGDVYGLKNATATDIDRIRFTVGLSAGGTAIDFTKVTMTWSDASNVYILPAEPTLYAAATDPRAGYWRIVDIQNGATTDALLENTEQYTIVAFLGDGKHLDTNEKFNLEIRPSTGAALGIKRTGPAKIDAVNLLY
ncbi:MAG: flagellin [Methanomicrobiales archaeon]|nr:flagellin [Methanomicrobiales archaeon]